ncbi:hypothetical protein LCGC14_0343250 [marine sediment metagenome]|uniref:Uncharacterized protein n=1 Tax=marine sediment metagenome TaxID=412755 RepID=A0A0F9TW07_9ZZZZ
MGKGFGLGDFNVPNGPTSSRKCIAGVDINSIRLLGLIPTASTEPSRESLETNFEGLRVSSSQTTAGDLTFCVPRDYDNQKDKLYVRFLAQMSGATDSAVTIDATLFRKREGVALTADLDPTISAAINISTTIAGWVEVKVEGQALLPGDAVTLVFTTAAHTTDSVDIYAVEVVYFGNDQYSKITER